MRRVFSWLKRVVLLLGMSFLLNLLVGGVAVFISAYVLPGVAVDSFVTAVIVSVILGVVNAIVKPILVLLTLPITILSLGLFLFVVNALMVLLVAAVVPGFWVNGFVTALLFSFILSAVSWFLQKLV